MLSGTVSGRRMLKSPDRSPLIRRRLDRPEAARTHAALLLILAIPISNSSPCLDRKLPAVSSEYAHKPVAGNLGELDLVLLRSYR